MITALGGGVGAAKFLKGLSAVIPHSELNIIVNTGDDIDIYGFRVSPDIDTVLYRLSGFVDSRKGWGIENDTYSCLEFLSKMGYETWFRLGDRDIAVQIFKQRLRANGLSESEITKTIAEKLGIGNYSVIPMTEKPVETWIKTEQGDIHFQEYYIKHSMAPQVEDIFFKGIADAKPSAGIVEAIENSELIIICPSNPVISIGPIIKINDIRQALVETKAKVVSVSPLVSGRPFKGPADRLMKALGMEVSSTQIAKIYDDFLDLMVIDHRDCQEKQKIETLGVDVLVTDTVMSNDAKSEQLSRTILDYFNAL